MNHLLFKLIFSLTVIYGLAALLPGVHVSLSYVVVTTVILVGLGWMGDRMLLPHLGMTTAMIADGAFTFVVLSFVAFLAPYSYVTVLYLVLASILMASLEAYLHRLIYNPEAYRKGASRS